MNYVWGSNVLCEIWGKNLCLYIYANTGMCQWQDYISQTLLLNNLVDKCKWLTGCWDALGCLSCVAQALYRPQNNPQKPPESISVWFRKLEVASGDFCRSFCRMFQGGTWQAGGGREAWGGANLWQPLATPISRLGHLYKSELTHWSCYCPPAGKGTSLPYPALAQ